MEIIGLQINQKRKTDISVIFFLNVFFLSASPELFQVSSLSFCLLAAAWLKHQGGRVRLGSAATTIYNLNDWDLYGA